MSEELSAYFCSIHRQSVCSCYGDRILRQEKEINRLKQEVRKKNTIQMSEELHDGLDGLRKTLSYAQELLSKMKNETLQEDESELRRLQAQNEKYREALDRIRTSNYFEYIAEEALKGE